MGETHGQISGNRLNPCFCTGVLPFSVEQKPVHVEMPAKLACLASINLANLATLASKLLV